MNSTRHWSDYICDTETFHIFWIAIKKSLRITVFVGTIYPFEQCWMGYKEAIINTIIIVTVMPLFYLLLIHLPGNRYSMNLNHFHVSQNVIHSFGRAVNQIKRCYMSGRGCSTNRTARAVLILSMNVKFYFQVSSLASQFSPFLDLWAVRVELTSNMLPQAARA